jgi:hypothetical protein
MSYVLKGEGCGDGLALFATQDLNGSNVFGFFIFELGFWWIDHKGAPRTVGFLAG